MGAIYDAPHLSIGSKGQFLPLDYRVQRNYCRVRSSDLAIAIAKLIDSIVRVIVLTVFVIVVFLVTVFSLGF